MSGGERELPVVLMNENGDARDIAPEPSTVFVRAYFTRTMQEAHIPIKVRITGTPGAGVEVGNVVLSPDVVTLRGTREALLGVSEINIDPIDVSGNTENINVDIPLDPPSDAIAIVGADHVNLRVEFRAAVETRTFLSVPVLLEGVGRDSWVVSPPVASVTVEKLASGAALDPDKPPLELYLDATNVIVPQITLPILARNLQGGVSVIRIEPPQAAITLKK
jgi:hypothetical protein